MLDADAQHLKPTDFKPLTGVTPVAHAEPCHCRADFGDAADGHVADKLADCSVLALRAVFLREQLEGGAEVPTPERGLAAEQVEFGPMLDRGELRTDLQLILRQRRASRFRRATLCGLSI